MSAAVAEAVGAWFTRLVWLLAVLGTALLIVTAYRAGYDRGYVAATSDASYRQGYMVGYEQAFDDVKAGGTPAERVP